MKIKCSHCHLIYDESIMIKDENLFFCCKGCQGVYHLLKDDGLDSFYEKLGNKTIAPPLKLASEDLSKFDSDSFAEVYVAKTDEGFDKIDLIIEGIHCAACVWLNEKVLYDTDGIVKADINFSTNKAKIIWDSDKLKLSDIILKIRSIGYDAYAYDSLVAEQEATKIKRDYFIRMAIAVIATMNIMMLAVAKYAGFFSGIDDSIKNLIHLGEFIISTPVIFYSGWIFFKGAYYGLKNRVLNMDFLVSSGVIFTYIYSFLVLINFIKGETYFDSVVMIITFVLVGKYLEVLGKKSAVDTLDKIKSSLPMEATIIKDGKKSVIALNNIKIGDILEIKAGEKIVVDGVILNGTALIDESSLTGESIPIYKKEGDELFSGTLNTNATIKIEATKDFKHSTFSSIVTLLEDSLNSKPKIQTIANNISKYFTVTILSLAIFSFFLWYLNNFDFGFYSNSSNFEKAFIVAISVIIIACPCALALATPIASLVGISQLAKKGLLFKEAKYIESLAKVDCVVFDKTGTLTTGELKVVKAKIKDENIHKLNLLYSLLDSSNHPISKSVKKYLLANYKLELKELSNIKNIEAKGVYAKYFNIENKEFELLGGNINLLRDYDIRYKFDSSNSVYLFAINRKVIASFELEDSIKEDAKELISYLNSKKIDTIMLTGDNALVAQKVSNRLGIKRYFYSQTPISKANFIKKLKKDDKNVVMVGDGLNDSVALSNSDIAIAMGNSADVSLSVSDVVLLNSSMKSLKDAFLISNRTYKIIKENLAISLIYNLITIPIAMLGYVVPFVAALSMSLSSLLVVLNSFRIKNIK